MPTIKHLKIFFVVFSCSLFSHQSFAAFTQLKYFGDNPGSLDASYFTPENSPLALVVMLHGCAQYGSELAQQSGFLGLAKKHNFALLLPQQSLKNNIKRCFNWYSNADFTKDVGESLSIKNMITTLQKQLGSKQVYIIGLSGGGAMTSAMLVNYPQLFNAGAVVSGIPFPCADDLIRGISCMKNGPSQTVAELTVLAQKLNPEQIIWPKLSVWTGTSDNIVNPLNSLMLAQQWAKLSKLTAKPSVDKKLGYTVTRWQNTKKEISVELIEVAERGHGIMVNPTVENGGEVSDYLLASPVSTAKQVIDFWQLR